MPEAAALGAVLAAAPPPPAVEEDSGSGRGSAVLDRAATSLCPLTVEVATAVDGGTTDGGLEAASAAADAFVEAWETNGGAAALDGVAATPLTAVDAVPPAGAPAELAAAVGAVTASAPGNGGGNASCNGGPCRAETLLAKTRDDGGNAYGCCCCCCCGGGWDINGGNGGALPFGS